MTVVTSFTRNDDLERVKLMTDMTEEANNLLNDFNLARVEIRSMFETVYSEDYYPVATEKLNSAVARIANLEAYSEKLDGYAAETNAQLREHLAGVQSDIDGVYANDGLVREALALLQESNAQMDDSASELVEIALSAAQSSTAGSDAVGSLLPKTQDLNEAIDDMLFASQRIVLSQDTSIYEELGAMLADIEARAGELEGMLTTAAERDALSTVRTGMESYESHLATVESLLLHSDEIIAEARQTFVDVSDVLTAGVSMITDEGDLLITNSQTTSTSVMFVLIVIALIAAVLSLATAAYLSRAITRPLGKMQAIFQQVNTTGNLQFSDEVREDVLKEAEIKDELGQSIGAFAGFIDRILYYANTLEQVAQRDLTVEVDSLGSDDTMGNSLSNMVQSLNEMFAEINSVAGQVSTSSSEIATGALRLAQGSTEQAATVEEIGASINEINEQMNASSLTTQAAVNQGNKISDIATDGSQKMGSMMEAVQEINDASQNINRVIKVIDDIAFQTNILALNAAVEAARAGTHGKGFAVVAEEVRNLASKSAEAARETATLISANIEKAELGLSISQETAESLSQIVDGIQETSESLRVLAEQSAATKAATAQVNSAIDQVAQVVQSNSATSEESAAASQEMSGQAQILQQLIDMFKLKDSKSIGAGKNAAPQQLTEPYDAMDDDRGPSVSPNNGLGKY